LQKRADKDLKELFNHNENWITAYDGNRYAKIRCAGQDETPQVRLDEASFAQNKDNKTGHCGHCIVCKAFGFSKKDISSQGMLFFSDLNILFFPVYTRFGVRWITSQRLLKENGLLTEEVEQKDVVFISSNEKDTSNKYINLGWLNLPYETQAFKIDLSKIDALDENDIVIVPDALLPQIINSNLEVRTSVSIDPLTGAAKDGALFTSEAIPRGTIFYGEVRCFSRGENLPEIDHVFKALRDSKKYYASLGIGGMTTRGFGRLEVKI
jgi:CRISPR-associated protein Cmr4